MDLKKFDFPKVTKGDIVFSTFTTNKELLKEAKERGFYNGNTSYNNLFSKLFFNGGKVKFKQDVDKEFINIAWNYCRSFMRSWEPKHEEKEATCSLIMSEILMPELDD